MVFHFTFIPTIILLTPCTVASLISAVFLFSNLFFNLKQKSASPAPPHPTPPHSEKKQQQQQFNKSKSHTTKVDPVAIVSSHVSVDVCLVYTLFGFVR